MIMISELFHFDYWRFKFFFLILKHIVKYNVFSVKMCSPYVIPTNFVISLSKYYFPNYVIIRGGIEPEMSPWDEKWSINCEKVNQVTMAGLNLFTNSNTLSLDLAPQKIGSTNGGTAHQTFNRNENIENKFILLTFTLKFFFLITAN